MNATAGESRHALRRMRMHRIIRQLHLWIGAWGAVAAVLFGLSGFLQNHRTVLRLPQGGATEFSQLQLPVPSQARTSPEALHDWLRDAHHLQLESQRSGPQGTQRTADPHGQRRGARWMLTGGNARTAIQAEYVPGAETVLVRTTVQSPLAVLSRLHKGIGGGIAWILLSDSFALGLIALGSSGLILWSRGRSLHQLILSIAGAAGVILLLVGASAVL
ncbi:MAG TPA: PepSY-associated TM helix domain-containing protein [Steroidobacteraceae bacterium]